MVFVIYEYYFYSLIFHLLLSVVYFLLPILLFFLSAPNKNMLFIDYLYYLSK